MLFKAKMNHPIENSNGIALCKKLDALGASTIQIFLDAIERPSCIWLVGAAPQKPIYAFLAVKNSFNLQSGSTFLIMMVGPFSSNIFHLFINKIDFLHQFFTLCTEFIFKLIMTNRIILLIGSNNKRINRDKAPSLLIT
jgi:hypothetical protein